ncbi:glycosyl transferase family 1, partial [Candidatus Micrarchaeota archaeon CG11_big_fil_rev_8_21_14_0_20_47_5]
MRVCLYQEGLEQMRRISKSGITAAFEHLKEALRAACVPYTTKIEGGEFDILHINLGIGPLSKYYAEKYKKLRKRVIIHAHSTAEDFEGSFRFSKRLKPVLRKVLPFFYGSADLILCPSAYTKGLLRSYGLRNEIKVISNGVNVRKYATSSRKRSEYRRKEGIKNGSVLVFCVGHVFSKKGALDFARIAEEMPQFHFRWFGTVYNNLFVDYGQLKKYLKKPPANLKFTGFYKDVLKAYSAGDIFLFPSYDEN